VFVAGSDGWGFFVCAMTAVPQNGFFLIIVNYLLKNMSGPIFLMSRF